MPQQVLTVAFLIFCSLLLYLLGVMFAPFFTSIMWALILVKLFYPMYQRMTGALHGRSTLSAAFSTISVTLLAVLPFAYLLFLVISETIHAYQAAVAWVQADGLNRLPEYIGRLPIIGHLSQPLLGRFIIAYGDVQASIIEGSKAVSGVLFTSVSGLARNTISLITNFFIIIFTLFFLFRDGHRLYRAFYDAIPIEESYKAVIFERLDHVVVAVVRGTLLTALAQGFTAGLAYAALGVPFPVFLGALSALFSLLPVGGTALVWGPVAVYLFFTAPVWKGLVMIGVGVGLVGLMDNFLQPLLVGSSADLPVLFLFFATLGGLAYFGFLGLFLGPILLGIFVAVFQIYRENYQSSCLLVKPESVRTLETTLKL
ncbi:AI-2E family transporter [Candidatus Nitrospira neomarina]|uniref:AI-2E family transporter n=1 Tax=Candidatus Nitrospira neomarina TaxID=3020899 RepID=A0AA96JYJ7_9BACT|nr:AI-2E family transporter [Candidatus Nitrospira neomarina]WNM64110.1 AI-2E family transporter [Candidatus Nitrospira neomarina]